MERSVRELHFSDDGRIPNSHLPLLIYSGALDGCGEEAAQELERRYARHGWGGTWRWGVYPFHHFHSTAHEVLGVYRGRARLQFGGESGETIEVQAGDAVVIPAGVGHKCLEAEADFHVVGGYPAGQSADLRRGDETDREAVRQTLRGLALPKSDPIHGGEGPLVRAWKIPSERPG